MNTCSMRRDATGWKCAPCGAGWVRDDGACQPDCARVKSSCGCVFCDLMLLPNGAGIHNTAEGHVKCTRVK